MKRSDRLRRHYGKLTTVERINLVLSAQERDDAEETQALEEHCRTIEALYYETRMLGLGHVAALLVVQLLACEVFLVNMCLHLPRAQEDGAIPSPDPALMSRLQSQLERQAATWRGFTTWCQDIGHDPRQVLRLAPIGPDETDPACFIIRQQIEQIEKQIEHAIEHAQDPFPDPDKVEMWRQMFARLFRPLDGTAAKPEP